MRLFVINVIFLLLPLHVHTQESLGQKLQELDSISFEKIPAIGSFAECYKILIKQALDHSDPGKGFFYQKFYLSHKSFDKPLVFFIDGYIAGRNKLNEWSEVLDANQVYAEHRYFGDSKPEKMDWSTLNLKNVAADLHRIRRLLNKIYPGKWISTGSSKGGLTAVSYKYFYPEDVKATIAQSTSVKVHACDTLFFNFTDSLGKKANCLESLKSFQRELLIKRLEIIPLLKDHFDKLGKKYDRLGLDAIFETAVLELAFSAWQNGSGCFGFKEIDTSAGALLQKLRSSIHDWFLTDEVFKALEAYHYQALTELGYYCYPTKGYKDLLASGTILPSVFAPENTNTIYSNKLMQDMRNWLTRSGNDIIYISGGNDPYSLYRICPTSDANSLDLLLHNRNHNQVSFRDLNHEQQKLILNYIEKRIK